MGNINLLITNYDAVNITALINNPACTVKQIRRIPTYALAYLAKDIPYNDNDDFYSRVINSLQYEFPPIPIEESLLGKRSFTVDKEYLEEVRRFIIRHDSKIKRPKSSFCIRIALAYTHMSFEDGKNEATAVIAPTLNGFEILQEIITLLKKSATSNDPRAVKKLNKIKEILRD